MKKNIKITWLFITIIFSSYNSANSQIIPISNIDKDFTITENLELDFFNKYDILRSGFCRIDNSILWHFGYDGNSLGHCYDLNTGNKLSSIAMQGRASYEFIESSPNSAFVGDSIQFYTSPNMSIKTFSKKEIIENKPMNERTFSVTTIPDSIYIYRMVKLPNGSVLGAIQPYVNRPRYKINEKSVAIFNNNEANSYETINYDSFDAEEGNSSIKMAYSNGRINIKGNDMAVFSVNNQFILYTFDINSGNVVKEKRYTMPQSSKLREGELVTGPTNDMEPSIYRLISNDKYILCYVTGYFSEEDKEAGLRKWAIFVFDWDLNPIKRFNLPKREVGCRYIISNDCSSVYLSESTDDGITLYKADLNL